MIMTIIMIMSMMMIMTMVMDEPRKEVQWRKPVPVLQVAVKCPPGGSCHLSCPPGGSEVLPAWPGLRGGCAAREIHTRHSPGGDTSSISTCSTYSTYSTYSTCSTFSTCSTCSPQDPSYNLVTCIAYLSYRGLHCMVLELLDSNIRQVPGVRGQE